jgi:L-threonylcarbamoyladenylate synthase
MTTTDSGIPHMHAELLVSSDTNIQRCAQALQNGQLVAFPTETVFGLGAAVSQRGAIEGIFKAKGRPSEHPLIAHVAPGADLTGWVAELTLTMQKLMNAFWPGPLTLVVPKGERMPFEVTGGQNAKSHLGAGGSTFGQPLWQSQPHTCKPRAGRAWRPNSVYSGWRCA